MGWGSVGSVRSWGWGYGVGGVGEVMGMGIWALELVGIWGRGRVGSGVRCAAHGAAGAWAQDLAGACARVRVGAWARGRVCACAHSGAPTCRLMCHVVRVGSVRLSARLSAPEVRKPCTLLHIPPGGYANPARWIQCRCGEVECGAYLVGGCAL